MKRIILTIFAILFCANIIYAQSQYNPNVYIVDSVMYAYGSVKTGPYSYYECKIPSVIGVIGTPQEIKIKETIDTEQGPWIIEAIRSSSFKDCKSITSVSIPNSISTIEYDAFSGCTGLTSVTIPNSVSTIEDRAFSGCTGLTSVSIPNSVSTIGDSAFSGCTGLTSVTIPGSVETIESCAFMDCIDLEKIVFNESNTILDVCNVFWGCTNIRELEINRIIESYGSFKGSSIQSISFGKNFSVITEHLFAGLSKLESIYIPSTVNLIMSDAFDECTNLKNVTFEESPEPLYMLEDLGKCGLEILNLNRQLYTGRIEIGEMGFFDCKPSFAGCTGLTSLNFGKYFNTISDNMFSGCSALRSVTIPSNIFMIGEGAFSGCLNLKSINIEDCDEPILINSKTNADGEGTTFANAPLETLYLGRNVEFNGTELSPFKNKTALTTLTIGNKTTAINNYLFYGCTNISMLSVPSSVKTIGDYAFYDCNQSRSLTISKSVESIGEYAFYNCKSLKTLTIPGSVVTIGDYAFRSCSNLTNIKIGEKVETIGNYAFLDCYSAENITLGNSVKEIGNNAFYNCQAWTEINIPNSVKTIGNDAFALCLGAKEVKIGDGVETIGLRSFTDCEGLNKLTIGESVKEIGEMAFFNCENLKEVYVAASIPPTANESVFSDYSAKLYVPEGTSTVYKADTDTCWPLFTSMGEYVPESGVDEVMSEPTDPSRIEVYTLNGVRIANSIDNLAPGLYIVRQGSRSKKVAIK